MSKRAPQPQHLSKYHTKGFPPPCQALPSMTTFASRARLSLIPHTGISHSFFQSFNLCLEVEGEAS